MTSSGPRAARFLLTMSGLYLALATVGPSCAQEEHAVMSPSANTTEMVFSSAGSTESTETPTDAEMRERLRDPNQREELRRETREHLRQMNPGLADALGLDSEREAKLMDVLTEQQMAHLERFYAEDREPGSSRSGLDGKASMRRSADEETRDKQQIRAVLGEERFERYLGYLDTLGERQEIAYFEARLGERDKLTPGQRDRLMTLLRAHEDRKHARGRQAASRPSPSRGHDPSPEAMERENVARNEELFLDMQEDSRALLQGLPAILTAKQLEVYAQLEASALASQRSHVQQLRVRAGMSPEFDETKRPASQAQRIPAAGKVRLELRLTADDNPPVTTDVVTKNGESAPLVQGPEGLWIEATPAGFGPWRSPKTPIVIAENGRW